MWKWAVGCAPGLKPSELIALDAALKRRSSTVGYQSDSIKKGTAEAAVPTWSVVLTNLLLG